MSRTNVKIINGLYESFARGDLRSVREKMAPDIEWYEAESFPYEDGNPYLGPDAILDGVYARLTGEWDGFTEELKSVMDAGEQVVTTGYYSGVYKPTAKAVRAQFVHVWTVRDGLVTAFQQYTDTAQFREATADRSP
ncbi:MAG: nuclear transport factor 2 family protein [Rubrobacteraceae bacterium]